MEQIFLRFPHLAEGIFEKLNNKTLAKCKVVSRSWKASIDDFKFTWIRALKNSSKDSLIRMLKSQLDRDKVKSIAMGTQELDLKKKEETAKRLLKVRNSVVSKCTKWHAHVFCFGKLCLKWFHINMCLHFQNVFLMTTSFHSGTHPK